MPDLSARTARHRPPTPAPIPTPIPTGATPPAALLLAALLLGAPALFALATPPAQARQLATVVGINQYRHGSDAPGPLRNLRGAVNDARVIAAALRANGVDLPADRVLLDDDATRAAFLAAWRRMVADSRPGDTLILGYAGHGGQETEFGPPRDEEDGRDETLMLHDFDPAAPGRGRIPDDELYGLFAQVPDRQILFVADACHSAGLSRSARAPKIGRSRFGGQWKIDLDLPPPPPAAPPLAETRADLPHLTLIAATRDEALTVDETQFGSTHHGALSWYFAKAVRGEADRDGRATLTRAELKDYLVTRVSAHMDHLQTPRLLPRGDTTTVLRLAAGASTGADTGAATAPPDAAPTPLPIQVQGGTAPAGLRRARIAEPYRLRLRIRGPRTEVASNNGDLLADIPTERAAWQAVIDRQHLLAALDRNYAPGLRPVRIGLDKGDGLHRHGKELEFKIAPEAPSDHPADDLPSLTLFNLPGDGRLQFLYPLGRNNPTIARLPYPLPPFQVTPPYGGDTLVAILCRRVPEALHDLLRAYDDKPAPQPEALLDALADHRCQIGRHSFFTAP